MLVIVYLKKKEKVMLVIVCDAEWIRFRFSK